MVAYHKLEKSRSKIFTITYSILPLLNDEKLQITSAVEINHYHHIKIRLKEKKYVKLNNIVLKAYNDDYWDDSKSVWRLY